MSCGPNSSQLVITKSTAGQKSAKESKDLDSLDWTSGATTTVKGDSAQEPSVIVTDLSCGPDLDI